MSHPDEGQVVTIIPVGDSLIITPKRLELDEARREIKKILKASGLTLEDLLTGLKEEREDLYKKKYGKKKVKVNTDSRSSTLQSLLKKHFQ